MSRLIGMVEIHQTNRRYGQLSGPIPYSDMVTIESKSWAPVPHLVEYNIEVRIGSSVRWGEEVSTEPLVRQVSRMIEQHVFGEFREDFNKIQRALFNHDIEGAQKSLDEMHARMFSS